MRVGISGTHGTGKTTLAQALCAGLPGHVTADEPYYLLEEEGYEFAFPPAREDYRALLNRSVRSLSSAPVQAGVIFDRTPLDYLAYLAATGADPASEADGAMLRSVVGRLDLLVITPITAETERVLPAAELPGLRADMNDALLELAYSDPLEAWGDVPLLELGGKLEDRPDTVLAALRHTRGRGGDGMAPEEPERPAPEIPEQSPEDTDAGWGERAEPDDDERRYGERPPHWE